MKTPADDDVTAIRELLAPLAGASLDEQRAAHIRRVALATLARERGWLAWLGRTLHQAEPALAFAVAAVYMGLALQAVFTVY